MLHLAILTVEDGQLVSEFEGYIKAVPRLTSFERQLLTLDYTNIKSAPPLCELAPTIIEIIENTETVFFDTFSESIFKKAFREIGYPGGGATYILEKVLKNTLKTKSALTLKDALDVLKIEHDITDGIDKCKAMEKIFHELDLLNSGNFTLPVISGSHIPLKNQTDFSHLPNTPGVYFFRDIEGEIIYVGKAKNIAKRVRSHFSSNLKFEIELCSQTVTIDFEETGSEIIALLLEAHYISDLKPSSNTLQKEIIDPYIIASKLDSKGILRIQLLQKSYSDSENEFYYNRTSVLEKIKEIQQKFFLCKRYTGIERASTKCSDPIFCKGICQNLEAKESYNKRVKEALEFIFAQRPSYMLRLNGRNPYEQGLVLVKHGIYQGFGFISNDSVINSIEDIESFIKAFPHNYFTSRIIDQFLKNRRIASKSLMPISI